MAARGWSSSVLTAIGVAAGVGAAQLGLGYGLEIIVWKGDVQSVWLSSLAWVLWIAATSTVVGAICADRLNVREPVSTMDSNRTGLFHALVDLAWRTVIALAAAIGALIVVVLVAVPTQSSRHGDGFALQITAGACAVVGVVLGLVVAIGALSTRAIASNVIASVCWIWALGMVAVGDGVRLGQPVGNAQLAVWSFVDGGWWHSLYLPGALLMLTVALFIGALAAWPAGRRGDNRIGVAISGATGPALVAAAYLVAAPSLKGVTTEPRSAFVAAFVIAPYVILAGLGGSILVAALGPKTERAANARPTRAAQDDALADWSRALSSVDSEPDDDDTTATGRVRVESIVGAKAATASADSRGHELDEDSYAPPRAYSSSAGQSAYATDEGDAEPVPSKATGRAKPVSSNRTTARTGTKPGTTKSTTTKPDPVTPLWPDPPTPEENKGTAKGPSGRSTGSGRRGGKGR